MMRGRFPELQSASRVRGAALSECPAAVTIETWVREFCGRSHADLGRPGPVCPFVPEALLIDSLWLTTIETRHEPDERSFIREAVEHYRQLFLDLEPRIGTDSLHKAILLLLPDASPTAIEEVQREMKPAVVSRGLMLGEFHPHLASGARHNPSFHALRSPIPMLVIRTMVEADLEFLLRRSDSLTVRLACVESYLRLLGWQLTRDRRHAAETALRDLRSAVEAETGQQHGRDVSEASPR
jgi:hypothetical protein